jgi:hypothetical protein
MVGGSSGPYMRAYPKGVVGGRQATKNGSRSEHVVLLGATGTWDERRRGIEKNKQRAVDSKRIRDERPENRRRARVEPFR